MSEDPKLTRGSIRRHVLTQTGPMMLGIGATMSVGVLDAYFVGKVGPDALTAIGFVFPVQVALQSLGVGVLVGINAAVSRALGARERADAESLALHGVVLGALLGLAIGGGLFLLQEPLFRALDADEAILPIIGEYMRPYAMGYPWLLLAMGGNGVLRGQGEALRSSAVLIVVAVVNWVLDPLLIVGWGPLPAYGVAGAAYATSIAFAMSALVGLAMVQMGQVKLRLRNFLKGPWRRGLRTLVRIGGPAAFSNSVNPMGLTLLTGILAGVSQDVVAGFGVAGRVQSVATVPLLALSSSIGPIVGQNWGAHQPERARSALRFSLLLSLAYGTAIAAVLVVFRDSVGGVFTDSEAIGGELGRYLLIAAWGFAGFGVLIVSNGAMNAVDRAFTALGVSLARVFLLMVPLAWLGRELAGADGVYGAVLAANLGGALLAYGAGRRALNPSRDRSDTPGPT